MNTDLIMGLCNSDTLIIKKKKEKKKKELQITPKYISFEILEGY